MGTAEDVDRFVEAVQRLKYTNSKWLKVVRPIPFLGTIVVQVMDTLHAKSAFLVEREMALAGVSNWKIVKEIGAGLIAGAMAVFLWSALAPFDAAGTGSFVIKLVAACLLTVLFIPYVVRGIAVLVGTLGHALGKGQRRIILNSNLSHMAKRNIFSPRQ